MRKKWFEYFLIVTMVCLFSIHSDCDPEPEPDPDDGSDEINLEYLRPIADAVPYELLGGGKIVFERCAMVNGDLYVIDLDTRTSWGFRETIAAPAVSPDGGKIAFTWCSQYESENCTDWDVIVMDIDGTDCRHVSRQEGADCCPSWTSDSQQVFFHQSPLPCSYIYRQSPVENPTDRVLIYTGCISTEPQQSMAPIGPVSASSQNELVFSTGDRIFKMNMDGSNLELLLGPVEQEVGRYGYHSPIWSPDGQKIAWIKTLLTDESQIVKYRIMIMEGNGDYPTPIKELFVYPIDLSITCNDISICWSPDGSKLLFNRPYGNHCACLYVINIDGTGLTQVTTFDRGYDRSVSWSR